MNVYSADREINEIGTQYVEHTLDCIADEIHNQLVQMNIFHEPAEVRARVAYQFNRVYHIADAVGRVFGKDICEAENATTVMRAIKSHGLLDFLDEARLKLQ